MEYVLPIVMLLIGVGLGVAGAWLAMRVRIEHAAERARAAGAAERATLVERLEQERRQSAEKLQLFSQAEQNLIDAFEALSAKALKSNNQSFLTLAETTFKNLQSTANQDLESRQKAIGAMVEPVAKSLEKVDANLRQLETVRAGAYADVSRHLQSLSETENKLRLETANLVKALRAPNVRGRWGEIQLKRVVELADMLDHCDFHEQVSETTEEGRLRPDMIIHLPGGVNIVVDAKAPLAAYLEALEATDEQVREQKLKDHARHVQGHIASLSKKSYWEQFQPAPDFVILFLPGEAFYDAAREHDPTLIEAAANQRVMIATPSSLIALLRTIALGWRQEKLARNAEEISCLGKELYERLASLGGHFGRLGERLDKAVEAYNASIGTLQSRVLVSARKFRDLGAANGDEEIAELAPIEHKTRPVDREELLESGAVARRIALEGGTAMAKQARFLDTPEE